MMIDAQTYDGQDMLDTVGDDVAAAFASIEGEIQLTSVARPMRGTLAMGVALFTRMTAVMPRHRLINR